MKRSVASRLALLTVGVLALPVADATSETPELTKARMRELGVPKGQAQRFTGEALFRGVDGARLRILRAGHGGARTPVRHACAACRLLARTHR